MKLSIIIPVFNERDLILEAIAQVESVRLIEGVEKELIIVDDGSTDGTREILKSIKNHKVFFHEKNLGKGSAIKTALACVTGEITIIQDADLEYDPTDINLLLAEMFRKNSSAVFGSRRLNRANKQYSGISYYWGGLFVTYFANWLYGLELTDEPTCYKMIKTEVLRDMKLECKRFEFCPEVVAKLVRMGHAISEVPIRYYPRKSSQGKKIQWTDGVEAMILLWKYRKYRKEKVYFNVFDRFLRALRIRAILKYIPVGSRHLDFGSGREGYLLAYLKLRRLIVHGVGIDTFSLESLEHGIELRRGGLERIKAGEKFDVVTMLAVLEHLQDPETALITLNQALRPGGRIILTVPSTYSKPVLEFLAFKLHLISEPEIRDHKHYYNRAMLLALLKKTGFSSVEHRYFQLFMNNFVIARK